jgi:pimeloyl-ACP methyl ester carboxylesterase
MTTILSVLLWVTGALIVVAALIAGYFAYVTRRIAAQAEKLVPAAGKFIDIDGNRIHYVDAGEGPPIVFVHGLGAQLLQFRHPLFDKFDGYRLIALDRPGAGYSVRASGASARLTEQARVVSRFIEALGLDRPLLVGHSLGGMIALTAALEHPQSISGIALLAPLTRYQDTVPPEFKALYIRSPLKRWLMANTMAIPTAMKYAPQTLAFVFGPQQPHEDYLIKGGGWAGLRPSHFYGAVSDFTAIELDLPALEKRYGEISMPAGILFGTEDRVLGYERHGLSMKGTIPGLETEILDGIGHMPHYAATDRVAAFIKRIADRAFGSSRR